MVPPLTDCTRPEMLGTSIVTSVAAIGDVAVGDVPLRLPRTATTSPTLRALNFTVCSSRVYVVDAVVVIVPVPASVLSVRGDPLILVTVPASPPQNPPPKEDGPPNPAPANGAPHANPKPPWPPNGGLCAAGNVLGVLAAAVVFAVEGDEAWVTIKPAVAPAMAMPSPIPNRRRRPPGLLAGSAGGGGGGGSGKSGIISTDQNSALICPKGYERARRPKRQGGPPKRCSISATQPASVLRSPILGNNGSPMCSPRPGPSLSSSSAAGPGHDRSTASSPSETASRSHANGTNGADTIASSRATLMAVRRMHATRAVSVSCHGAQRSRYWLPSVQRLRDASASRPSRPRRSAAPRPARRRARLPPARARRRPERSSRTASRSA